MRWPGVFACLGGFAQRCVTERRSGSARSRSVRSGVELSCAKADESGGPGRTGHHGGLPSAVSWRGGLPRPNEQGLATGERNPRLLAGQGKHRWVARARYPPLMQARVLCAGSGAADVALAAEWRWLPSLRGRHLASCVGWRRGLEHLHSEPLLRHGAAFS